MPVLWYEVSQGFWRTRDGRFDLFSSQDQIGEVFTAIDWDYGKRIRTRTKEGAVEWCQERAGKYENAT